MSVLAATMRTPALPALAETSPPPSPAGPVGDDHPIRMPPGRAHGRFAQSVRFVSGPMGTNLAARRDFGDVWQLHLLSRREPFVVTCHPDHVRSLFKAAPHDAPSLTGESPLRPILGPSSVLTSVGQRHMRQRKLLLPAFHGEAVQRYAEMIRAVADQEIDRWPVGKPFSLAPRMQAVTLDVIMGGVFGIVGTPPRGSAEFRLREVIRRILAASTKPLYQVVEFQNAGRKEPRGILRAVLALVDRQLYALIRRRRLQGVDPERHDVLSLLLQARDEDGVALTDRELRDELMTLVLAGHETTANSLAWTFERLLRTPQAYDRLRELTRAGDDSYIEATVHEGMRTRPVIPMIVRMAKRRWQLGEYIIPAGTPVAVSIVALHHREDVYPDPFAFRPERFLDRKQPDDPGAAGSGEAGCRVGRTQPDDPGAAGSDEAGCRVGRTPGTYTWIPFGGGIRRCLGATLAMAEQRVVVRAIARRTDLVAPDPAPEKPRQRNVTMIPRHGGRVMVQRKIAA